MFTNTKDCGHIKITTLEAEKDDKIDSSQLHKAALLAWLKEFGTYCRLASRPHSTRSKALLNEIFQPKIRSSSYHIWGHTGRKQS